MKLFLRWFIIAVSLVVATLLVPGITIESERGWLVIAVMAVILGLVNAIIRPILAFLSCGCIIITMGLFMLIVNALSFLFAGWLAGELGIPFYVEGFWDAFWGALIVSITSFLLSIVLIDD
ncbi:MAG: phage holin family protein [Anaerolineales bacterium]|nr:phage holin family protein [Anaerolineales bacterium]